jgi:hypothetical protein
LGWRGGVAQRGETIGLAASRRFHGDLAEVDPTVAERSSDRDDVIPTRFHVMARGTPNKSQEGNDVRGESQSLIALPVLAAFLGLVATLAIANPLFM